MAIHQSLLNGSQIEWTTARGSTRYTYVHNRTTGSGYWIDETYQLHDGSYLGTRYHLRLYEGGSGTNRWTAIQVHREHWDWFRLRHTVDSVDRAQDYLEREFFGTWYLDHVTRVRFANAGAIDSDGWVSVIHLTDRGLLAPHPLSISFGVWLVALYHLTGQDRSATVQTVRQQVAKYSINPSTFLLFGSLALFPLVIRLSGITLEQAFPTLSPKIIAAVLYPVLVIGIPGCAIGFSRRLQAQLSAVVSIFAFGVGILLDYAYLNIAALPIDIVVHRAVLLVAVGLLAAGGSRSSVDEFSKNPLIAAGTIIWIVGLAVPLLDLY